MARCPNCDAEVPPGARFCPHCGAAQVRPTNPEQPSLPFSPWTLPHPAPQPAGGWTQGRAEPMVGPPLTLTQVAITVGAILLFLLAVIVIGHGWSGGRHTTAAPAAGAQIPVLGVKGQVVKTGATSWGTAFAGTVRHFDHRTPVHGAFYAIGLVVMNRGQQSIMLDNRSLALMSGESSTQYQPLLTAWGTPHDLQAGHYLSRYPLTPNHAVAGIIIFDVPPALAKPRLLIRDLTLAAPDFTGAIDLERESK